MKRLSVFNSITLDGYFTGPGGDLSWAYATAPDPEFQAFVQSNASGTSTLLLGRVTYDMMVAYWPTPAAAQNDPVVARGMNDARKIVFSRTIQRSDWANTSFVAGDVPEIVRRLKQDSDREIVVLGSGSIVAQLARADLIDGVQLVVKPVALGSGRTMFDGLTQPYALELTGTRAFGDGSVLLNYIRSR